MRGARAWGFKHEDGTEGTVYAKLFPSVHKDAVHISEIFAHPTGKGFGTDILQRILDEADKQGVTLDLSAVPYGEDKMPPQDLIEYYRKHGFKLRGEGFADDEMVRKPKKRSKSFDVTMIKSGSDCGANQPGGGGFVEGNTCASGDNRATETTIGLRDVMDEITAKTGKKFPVGESDQMAHVVSLHEKGKITKKQRDKYFKELERFFDNDLKARGFGRGDTLFPKAQNVTIKERATINKDKALAELGLEDTPLEKIAMAAGVGDNANVHVEYRSKDITFHVTDGYRSQSKLYKDDNGDFVIYNRYMEVTKKGKGLGTEVLQRQVEAAAKLGVTKLKGNAVRRQGTTGIPLVGYYVWPRLGYDAKLTDLQKNALPKGLKEYAESVSDLMMSKRGRDYWKENGTSINVEFDLTKNSWGRKTLERLVKKRRGDQ